MSKFDPYHKWLGISPKDQPPHHYRLLGIDLFETDPDVIDAAAERQMTFVHQVATGEHAAASQTLLNEIAAARLCLLDDKRRRQYEATLKPTTSRKHWLLLAGAVIAVIVIGVGIAALLMTTAKDDRGVSPAIVVDHADGSKPQPSRPTPDSESDQQPLTAEKQSESPESVAVESAPSETKAEEKKEEDNAVTEAPQTDEVASEQQTLPNEPIPEVKPAQAKTASVPQAVAPRTAPTAENVTKPAPPKTVQEIEYPQRTDPFSGGYPKELADVLQAISDDEYNRSLELLSDLNVVAAQIKDHQLAGDVQELTRKCRQLQKSIKQVEAAKAALEINPHDPAANEELGKFYCIEKEDWDAGLRLLAKCGNEDLKQAAQLDLKPPANKTEEAALAHQWLDFANSERVRTAKQRFQLRGRYWFLKARPLLPRDVQTALQERIDKIPLFADRVIIWNQHNYIHKDRGSEACVVTLLRNGKKVSQKSISLKWKPAAPASTTLRIRRQRVDAIRVDVTKYRGLGGGLGEVEVYDGSINISRYTSAVGSQYFHNEHKYHPNQVTDGNSSGHRGFWILPDGKTGWVMIDFYRLLPDH